MFAAKAPSLRRELETAKELGLPYLILDGPIVASDRCAENKTRTKGRQIDRWYSGKVHHPARTSRCCRRRAASRCESATCSLAAPMT